MIAAPDGPREADARSVELAGGLAAVRARIEAACTACGRRSEDVGLVVVTKFFPAADIARLARLGVEDVGESRDQEASAKVDELRATGLALPRVHFIGQLQTNKAASVAGYADVVHSVDRGRLVHALQHGADRHGRTVDVLVQVDLDDTDSPGPAPGSPGRGGVGPAGLLALAETVAQCPALRLRGLMGVAPLEGDPRSAFDLLARLSAQLRAEHPGADEMSAGMSGDLEPAVAAGATLLRVGSAILGSRPARG